MFRLLESIGTNESLRERGTDKEMQLAEVPKCDRYKALQVDMEESKCKELLWKIQERDYNFL